MSDDWKDEEKEPELRGWLQLWEAPPTPGRLDERVGASYRSGVRVSLWKRLARGRVTLPVPVAALFVILLAITSSLAAWAFRREMQSPGGEHESQASTSRGLADLRPLPEIRVTVERGGGSDVRP